MKKTIVILNQSHSLLEEQKMLLEDKFGSYEILSVPSEGWTVNQMKKLVEEKNLHSGNIVFASPVPFLLGYLAHLAGVGYGAAREMRISLVGVNLSVYIFHNDVREKKELPNGKIIFTVSQTGWDIIPVQSD